MMKKSVKNIIQCRDAMELLKSLPDRTIDFVFTDPPYSQEAHSRGWDINKNRRLYKDMAEWTNDKNNFYSAEWLDEYMRVCIRPNIFLFCNEKEIPGLLNYAKKHKLKSTRLIPIIKETPVPFSNNNWLSNEFGVHLCGERLGYNDDYHYKIPYFMFSSGKGDTQHPNEKPLSVCRKIILNCSRPGDTILDPFTGSGSIPCACIREGRDYIASDINKNFVKWAKLRAVQHGQTMEFPFDPF